MTKLKTPFELAEEIFESHGDRFLFFQNRFHYCREEDNLWEVYANPFSFLRLLEKGYIPKDLPSNFYACSKELRQMCYTEKIPTNAKILSLKGKKVFDLVLGELRDRKPSDHCYSTLSTKYDPKADNKVFLDFLKDVLGDQAEDFLQFMGSILAGDTRYIGYFSTHDSCGVSVLIKAISSVLEETFGYYPTFESTMSSVKHTIGGFIEYRVDEQGDKEFKKLFIENHGKCGSMFKESRSWVPIFVGPVDKKLWITGYAREDHRDLRVFEFNASFVHIPTEKHEKKLDPNMYYRVLKNRESILRTLLDYTKKHIENHKNLLTYKLISQVKWSPDSLKLDFDGNELNKF